MTVTILRGDCRDVLKTLPDQSVHCVVTSPPYWGLRDYGTAQWTGGNPDCNHIAGPARQDQNRETPGGRGGSFRGGKIQYRYECVCGAHRIDNQLGMERSLGQYVDTMVAVFAEVRRVLRNDGTLWLNLGDSYAASPNGRSAADVKAIGNDDRTFRDKPFSTVGGVLKPKDLCGIPWRVAFALQADGWWLRQDIIWAKPNPMPESIKDRCTKAHEYMFLLSKRDRYFYDAEAIVEEASGMLPGNTVPIKGTGERFMDTRGGLLACAIKARENGGFASRNKRSVWEIATQPFSEAHFATFPPALIEPCIMAGCPAQCCNRCGAPWVRDIQVVSRPNVNGPEHRKQNGDIYYRNYPGNHGVGGDLRERIGTGALIPSCSCNAATVPGTVLDPFGGAGTTGLVADRLGRNAILIELNPDYAAMAERRIHDDAGMFAEIRSE